MVCNVHNHLFSRKSIARNVWHLCGVFFVFKSARSHDGGRYESILILLKYSSVTTALVTSSSVRSYDVGYLPLGCFLVSLRAASLSRVVFIFVSTSQSFFALSLTLHKVCHHTVAAQAWVSHCKTIKQKVDRFQIISVALEKGSLAGERKGEMSPSWSQTYWSMSHL